MQVCVSLCIC